MIQLDRCWLDQLSCMSFSPTLLGLEMICGQKLKISVAEKSMCLKACFKQEICITVLLDQPTLLI